MRKIFSPKMAVLLTVVATMAWAASIETAYGTILNRPADPPPCGCKIDPNAKTLTRDELAKALQNSLGGVSFAPASGQLNPIDPVPGDNCVKGMSSCGTRLGCWKVFGGGSQYTYSNGILACQNDKASNCYDVRCHVLMYSNPGCKDDPDDDTYLDRRGCKKQKTVVGIEAGLGTSK